MQEQFWDEVWSDREPYALDSQKVCEVAGPGTPKFLHVLGDLNGKQVLDIGCGGGEFTVWAAKQGANVTAIDVSEEALGITSALAEYNGVASRVEYAKVDAMDLGGLGKQYDIALGKFILHHIEPFAEFVGVLHQVLKNEGRGVFWENNARNPILMLSRAIFPGRFGIPKYGDEEEYPFEPRELAMLERQFDRVSIHYPNFVFFDMFSKYIFQYRRQFRYATQALQKLDEAIYAHFSPLHKYGYYQIVDFKKSA